MGVANQLQQIKMGTMPQVQLAICLAASLLVAMVVSEGGDVTFTRKMAWQETKGRFEEGSPCHTSIISGLEVKFCYSTYVIDDWDLMGTPGRQLIRAPERITNLWQGEKNAMGYNVTYATGDCWGWSDANTNIYRSIQGISINPIAGYPNVDIHGSFVPKFNNRPITETSKIGWKFAYAPDGSDESSRIMDKGSFLMGRHNLSSDYGYVMSGKDATGGLSLSGFTHGYLFMWISNQYNNTEFNQGTINVCDDHITYRFRDASYVPPANAHIVNLAQVGGEQQEPQQPAAQEPQQPAANTLQS